MILSKEWIPTTSQLSLLEKGLTFVPSCKANTHTRTMEAQMDLQGYHRRLKILTFFENHPQTTPPPFTPASSWIPTDEKLPTQLLHLIQRDRKSFKGNFRPKAETPNLTPDEIQALKELMDNKQVVIKPADKGSKVVIMDRTQYLWEGYRQLSDTKYYLKLDAPIYKDTTPMVKNIVQSLYNKKFINAKQKTYLIGDTEPRARKFYMLPKIHKKPEAWSKPHEIPPGRPIVSDCGSETYHTAEYLDHFLNPLSIVHPSYIKDTYDFIQKIKSIRVPFEATLFTIDIDSLYTNIDTKEGIQAIKNIFQKNPDPKRPDKEIVQFLEINLSRNDFIFNGEFYLQIKGTAMGKKFAPAYANIFMAEWEASALASSPKKPAHYYRYLDDIWGVWTHSREDFLEWVDHLNAHNPSIKIKFETHTQSVNFLDTTTFKGPDFSTTGILDTKVFFKETDTHALLHARSFHPKHTFAGLVKSQLLRFHRICTKHEDFMEATRILFKALKQRGYNRSLLRKTLRSFRENRRQTTEPQIPFVVTYSTAATQLAQKIKASFSQFTTQHNILKNHTVITAFRKNKSLKDILIKAELKPIEPQPHARTPYPEYYRKRRFVYNRTTKEVYSTHPTGTPDTKNCVYIIECKECGLQYVGETGNTIRTRLTQHKYNITRQKNTNTHVTQHFIGHGWEAVGVTALEANPNWTTAQRRRSERLWISKLDTRFPKGLNIRLLG